MRVKDGKEILKYTYGERYIKESETVNIQVYLHDI